MISILIAFVKVGGIQGLMVKYFEAIPSHALPNDILLANSTHSSVLYNITSSMFNVTKNTCGLPRSDAFHILRDPINSDLPWPGILVRSTFVSVWYWCADQVGRVLAWRLLDCTPYKLTQFKMTQQFNLIKITSDSIYIRVSYLYIEYISSAISNLQPFRVY